MAEELAEPVRVNVPDVTSRVLPERVPESATVPVLTVLPISVPETVPPFKVATLDTVKGPAPLREPEPFCV